MNAVNRRRWTVQDKLALIRQTLQPGHTVSSVAREHAVNPSQLFQWKRQYQEGLLTEVTSDQPVVPASELAAAIRRIRELERMLGKKTLENEMLKEAAQASQGHRWSLTQVGGA